MHPFRAYLLRFVLELTDADWQPLRVRHLARGEHLLQAGEHLPVLALLLQGSCRLYYPVPTGRSVPLTSFLRITCWPTTLAV